MSAVPLSREILDRWLGAVEREMGSSLGYTEPADVQAVASAFAGRRVPAELLTLWSWRSIPSLAPDTGVYARPLSPAECAEWSREIKELDEELVARDGGDLPSYWSEDYVIWSQLDRSWFIVDFAEPGPTSPVYAEFDANTSQPLGRAADSLGQLFEHWTMLIENRIEYYEDGWTYSQSYKPYPPLNGS